MPGFVIITFPGKVLAGNPFIRKCCVIRWASSALSVFTTKRPSISERFTDETLPEHLTDFTI